MGDVFILVAGLTEEALEAYNPVPTTSRDVEASPLEEPTEGVNRVGPSKVQIAIIPSQMPLNLICWTGTF